MKRVYSLITLLVPAPSHTKKTVSHSYDQFVLKVQSFCALIVLCEKRISFKKEILKRVNIVGVLHNIQIGSLRTSEISIMS